MADHDLRVLWVIKGLGPGGAEQLLVNHAGVAGPGIHYHAVYAVPWKDHLVPVLAERGVPATCIGARRLTAVAWVPGLARLLWSGGFDVVHVHSPLLAAATRVLVRLMPRRRRPRVVTTEHNRWDRYSPPTRWVNRLTAGLDDATIAVSDDVRDTIPERHRSRVETLHHGIDVDGVGAHAAERDRVRAELGLAPGALVAGTVANYRKQKAYPDLLAAYRRMIDAVPDLQVVIVGQGPLEDEVTRIHHELGLGDQVRLLGYVPDAARVAAAFDVFVLASHFEGLPVAVMEALALGVPVVATDVGGLSEAVDETCGRLVPPGDVEALAAAAVEVLTDVDLYQHLAAGAVERSSRFGIAPAAARIEALYRDM